MTKENAFLSSNYKTHNDLLMYDTKDYKHLLGLTGFSDVLLNNHITLYQGYVKNVNTIIAKLENLAVGTPEYAEVRRRFGWEWNGMRLHELYFGNLTANGNHAPEGPLVNAIAAQWGSIAAWRADFMAVGALRGIGWVILTADFATGRLFNVWINEHDGGHLAGTVPIVVMDVFEHAFMTDYGLNRAGYISAFMDALDWAEVMRRYETVTVT